MRRDERGIVLLEWIMALAFILLPVVGLAGAAVQWSPRVNAANSTAYEAAKTAVATLDEDSARVRAEEVWTNHGFPADQLEVSFSGDPTARGTDVVVTVTVQLPLVRLPGAGGYGDLSHSVSHRERVPDYRSLR